jgi:hypothetical protein
MIHSKGSNLSHNYRLCSQLTVVDGRAIGKFLVVPSSTDFSIETIHWVAPTLVMHFHKRVLHYWVYLGTYIGTYLSALIGSPTTRDSVIGSPTTRDSAIGSPTTRDSAIGPRVKWGQVTL